MKKDRQADSGLTDNGPVDDLNDDVTVAASADLVDQIRRKGAVLRGSPQLPPPDALDDDPSTQIDRSESQTLAGAFGASRKVDDIDDDVTVPAPSGALQAAARQSLPTEPSTGAKRQSKREPRTRAVAPSRPAPFRDDEASLIAEQQSNGTVVDRSWEPPARFTPEAAAQASVASPGMKKFYLLLIAAVILTAVVTAAVVMALTRAA